MKKWLLLLCTVVLAFVGRASAVSAQPTLPAKITPALRQALALHPADLPISVIVTFADQADLERASGEWRVATGSAPGKAVIRSLQATAHRTQEAFAETLALRSASHAALHGIESVEYFWIFNGAAVRATPAAIDALADMPEISSIAADAIELVPAQGEGAVGANLNSVGAPALWQQGWQGQGIVVANLDTGVDGSHPALAPRWRGGSNSWFDPFGEHPQYPYDRNGHGTWTMGVMVGGAEDGSSIGMAPQAQWIAARIFNDRGQSSAVAVHRSFQWLLDPDGNPNTPDAPHVVNNSWTFTVPGCDLAFELDLRALRAAGILPIFAAGNSGPNAGTGMSPANNPSALAVGATDNGAGLYAGSSRGPSSCGESAVAYPDLTAPGVEIRSTGLFGTYEKATGTSLAAPHVAGGLALLLGAVGPLPAALQEAALLNGAQDMGVPGPDQSYGHGQFDLPAAASWLAGSELTLQATTPIVVTTVQDGVIADQACGLREAILAANTDSAVGGCPAGSGADTILVDAALPRPAIFNLTAAGAGEDGGLTGDLDIAGTLSISGMLPSASAQEVDAAPSADAIILDGTGADRVIHILPGAKLTLAGLILRNGSVPIADDGGGAKVMGSLTLHTVNVRANQGGGVANDGGSLNFTDVVVEGNTGGYGIYNKNIASLTMAGGAIRDNQGGGLFNSTSTAVLTGVTIAGNIAGGGVISSGQVVTRLTLKASSILSNTGTNGGGIANLGIGATASIADTRVAYNRASGGGGGIYNNASMTINASTVDHNEAPSGAGIHQFGGTLGLTNVTISANIAGDNGGGIYNRSSTTLAFVTMAGNSAAGEGGSLFNDEAQIAIAGSIVAGAAGGAAGGNNCANSSGTISSQGYNIDSASSCGFTAVGDMTNVDPLLAPLADNGGPTLTHAPGEASPAVDVIPPGTLGCALQITRDQRGVVRPAGSGCDAGALEAGGYADLSVALTSSAYALGANKRLTFTVTVANAGPLASANVTVTTVLPNGINLLDAGIPGGSCAEAATGMVVCRLALLTAGAEAAGILVTTAPARTGSLAVASEATASTSDLAAGNNRATVTLGALTRIHQIQGAGHTSPQSGQTVVTRGIVTAQRAGGFYLQDPIGDGNPATSEGIYVATAGAPSVAVGDFAGVMGQVAELQPEAASPNDLTITAIVESVVVVESSRSILPAPVIWGADGRWPPSTVIEDDAFGAFEPLTDGIDFAESLEAMRVQVNNAIVVGPRNHAGEIWVVADLVAGAGPQTSRSGLYITPADYNPERLQLDDTLYPAANWPAAGVGTQFSLPPVGILDYSAANYELLVTEPVTVDTGAQLTRTTTALHGDPAHFTIATLDAGGVGGSAPDAAYAAQAGLVVDHLGSPDLLMLAGMQDNSGPNDDGVTAADIPFTRLADAIASAGGPTYAYTQIDPLNNDDGGPAGSNSRLGFLYNPARIGLTQEPGDATTATQVACASGVAALTKNPGRVAPSQPAFANTAKSLAAEFQFAGQRLFVVSMAFVTKAGDTPIYGAIQPPIVHSETQRMAQAAAVASFVAELLACEPTARVVVLGNANDFHFSAALAALKGTSLTNLGEFLLPESAQYTHIVEGNSQMLAHTLVSAALLPQAAYEIVHVNAEFTGAASEQDPGVARLRVGDMSSSPILYLPHIMRP